MAEYIKDCTLSSRPGEWGQKVMTKIMAIILVFILGIFVGFAWKEAQLKPYASGQYWSSVLVPNEPND